MKSKIGLRVWLVIILVGLSGQLAWCLENMYFNVFLYNTISTDPGYISAMVSASAVTATLATLIIGALSDRIGNRRIFISVGYILWGISTIAFGYITLDNVSKWFPMANAAAAGALIVVIMDCIMSFFGSASHDAAFNAYVTDNVKSENRGKTEGVIAILPLISMLIVFGLLDGYTQRGEWSSFFNFFGYTVIAVGIISFFLVKDDPALKGKKDSYFANLIYGLRPGVIKQQGRLYLAFAAICIFSIAVQVFYPYLIIYIQNYLGFDDYAIILGIVLIVASIVSVAGGRLMDRVGKLKFILPAGLVMIIGLIAMYFLRSMIAVIIGGCIMMGGYMLVNATLYAVIRDYTPRDKAGHFQGIRMIFTVMVPMVVGSNIGAAVIKGGELTYVEMGVVKTVPTPAIFLVAAIVMLFILIPVIALKKCEKNDLQA